MRDIILLLLVCVSGYGIAAQYPQGHNVSFYFWSCSISGRLQDGTCCDNNTITNCPAHCDVHFFVCIREHNETSNYCDENTTSHFTYFHYAYLDVYNITFFEGDNVFGQGLHNPLVYSFSGNWSKRIQTVLVARDFDIHLLEPYYRFEYIDYIDVNWTVPAGRAVDRRSYDGVFRNMVVQVGLKVDCWKGWFGDYCITFCVARDDIEGHYTCNADGTKECYEHWSGINCNFSSTHCYPPCPVNKVCNSGACSDCSDGYGGADCSCVDNNICDPSGGHCLIPCVNGGVCSAGICGCPEFYTGTNCNAVVDVCDSSVDPSDCPTGKGTCLNTPETSMGYTCSCEVGYTGESCENDIDDCVDSPCGDNGECQDLLNNFECNCNPGFLGELCQEDIDECASSPCMNGGTCQDGNNDFTCTCPAGTLEPICQSPPECDRSSCSQHGDCEVDETSQVAVCICDTGYTGEQCGTLINYCDPDPCPQGYVCQKGIGFHLCCYDNTDAGCQEPGINAIIGNGAFSQITIIAIAMGIVVGILVTVVVVVIAIACCIARHRKAARVPAQRNVGPPDVNGAFTNPIYEENLPTYEEIGAIMFQKEKALPYEEPTYETMLELKKEAMGYMSENLGFVSAEEEKKALENKYS